MKKKLCIILILIISLIIIYFIYRRVTFNNYIDDTIKYSDKINYTTNMILKIDSKVTSSKIEYNLVKSFNIKKISIISYKDKDKESSIQKYIVKKADKKVTYVKSKDEYKIQNDDNEDFYINYKILKNGTIKKKKNKTYKIRLKAYDAYNLIYKKDVMTKKDLDFYVDVIVKMDDKNNFIKEISYKINNLNNSDNEYNQLNYDVKIKNSDINNQNQIKLPFKN